MFQTLTQLQDWVSCDWLYRYFSHRAQQHLRAKLDEELDELEKELRRKELSTENILEEIGDVLWCAIALLINCRMPLEWAVRVSRLCTDEQEANVAIELIDRLAVTIQHPWESPQRLLRYDTAMSSEDVQAAVQSGDVGVTVAVIRALSHFVSKHSWRVRLGLETDPDSGWTRHEQMWVADSITQLMLCLSVVCRQFGSGLAEVAEATRVKHQDRISSGLPVAKQPPER